MEQKVCLGRFVQCRFKSLDQLVRQSADKAHGVADDHLQGVADLEQAAGGVQGIKDPVVGRDVSNVANNWSAA